MRRRRRQQPRVPSLPDCEAFRWMALCIVGNILLDDLLSVDEERTEGIIFAQCEKFVADDGVHFILPSIAFKTSLKAFPLPRKYFFALSSIAVSTDSFADVRSTTTKSRNSAIALFCFRVCIVNLSLILICRA